MVVDNSSDPSVRAVVERHGATYVDPGRNLGFGAGVNVGLEHRAVTGDPGPDDLLLLNPDASITPDAIARLRDQLQAADDLACVAPAQLDPVTGEEARVGWPFPTPARAWLEALGLGRLGGGTDFLIGSVLLVRAEALAEVGPFDERFFLYAEETDWQRRAHDLGWKVALCPEVVATHVGAGTGGDQSERDTHFHASNERYLRKHYGTVGLVGLPHRGDGRGPGAGSPPPRRSGAACRGQVPPLSDRAAARPKPDCAADRAPD